MSRIMRAKMPAFYADVYIDPAPDLNGVTLKIGDTHLHLRTEKALLIADTIVDQIEQQEQVRKLVRE